MASTVSPRPPASFPAALAAIAGVPGWLSDDQAQRLFDRASDLPPGSRIVEIGSYQGRSAIVLALAAGEHAEVVAIDAHDGDNRGPQQVRGEAEEGDGDFARLHANLANAGVVDRVRHVRKRSQQALGDVDGPVDLLYVDGAHQYRAAGADLRRWGDRVPVGGTMLVHDGFSSVGVTLATLRLMALSRDWRYVGRSRTLLEYRREPASRRANLRAHVAELPFFARNVVIKLAIVTRQRWICRALGHEEAGWPY